MNLEKLPQEGDAQEPILPEAGAKEHSNEEPLPEIRDAQTFEELYAALDHIGELRGGDGAIYSVEELKQRIAAARRTKVAILLDMVTRTGGLRDKARELLKKEKEKK